MLILKNFLCRLDVGIPFLPVVLDVALESESKPRSASYNGILLTAGLWKKPVSCDNSRNFWFRRFSYICLIFMRLGFDPV